MKLENLVFQDHQDSQDQVGHLDLQVPEENLDQEVRVDLLDLQVNQGNQEQRDQEVKVAFQDPQDLEELLVKEEPLVPLDLMGCKVNLAPEETEENQVLLDHQVPQAREVRLESLERMVDLAHQDLLGLRVHQGQEVNLVRLGLLDHLDQGVHQEHQDKQVQYYTLFNLKTAIISNAGHL